MSVRSSRRGMSYKRAGRILAAILLVGLALTPFVGDDALAVAALVASAVMTAWLITDLVHETKNPLRRRKWGRVAMIAVEYLVLLLVVGTAFVLIFSSLTR